MQVAEQSKQVQIGRVGDSTAIGLDCKWYHKGSTHRQRCYHQRQSQCHKRCIRYLHRGANRVWQHHKRYRGSNYRGLGYAAI